MKAFVFSLSSLISYASFMILKFRRRIRITKFIAFIHGVLGILMFSSLTFLVLSEVKAFRITMLAGIPFLLAGIYFITKASRKLRSQTFFPGEILITDGIYAKTRNPMYLGILLVSFGLSLATLSLLVLIYSVLLTFAYFFIIKSEERELERLFGEKYTTYKNSVPMLLPRLRSG